ncbi:hypothetical protein KIN20_025009 [Parelaphostrongylus tenuis]|uniref:Uncharacterized protein n=1 Tax=Parelaphostrongylus tenuis TaxID=148309 RepID=A0AAD5NAF5_PARTN|nr:hypothetical protein KIN20_025009 [Parelaphostrongylus tenuis]
MGDTPCSDTMRRWDKELFPRPSKCITLCQVEKEMLTQPVTPQIHRRCLRTSTNVFTAPVRKRVT